MNSNILSFGVENEFAARVCHFDLLVVTCYAYFVDSALGIAAPDVPECSLAQT
jgi:hypothetical protein